MKTLLAVLIGLFVMGCKKDSPKEQDPAPVRTPTILTGTEWINNPAKQTRTFTEDTMYIYATQNTTYVSYYTIDKDSFLFVKQIYTIKFNGGHYPTPDNPGEHYKAFIGTKLYAGTEDPDVPGEYYKDFWGDKTK